MQTTLIYIAQVHSDALILKFGNAIKHIDEITSLNSIDEIFVAAPKDNSPEAKRTLMLKIMYEWDSISNRFIDPKIRAAAKKNIAMIRRLLISDNFKDTIAPHKQLSDYSNTDHKQRVTNEQVRLFKPYCTKNKNRSELDLIFIEITAKQLQPHTELKNFDEELDRLMQRLKRMPEGKDCLNYLVKVDKKISILSNKVFNLGLMVAEIRAEDKVEAAKNSGLDESVRLMKQLMREPWPIIIKSRTENKAHFVDRNLLIAIDNLKESWGAGTLIKIDFGDDTPLIYKSAEKVRAAGVISHRYADSGHFNIQITALVDRVSEEALGKGSLSMTIDPSPTSMARQLAAMFLNMRFLLSLMVALVIQVWKLNRDMPFGSYGRDYIEAFAIGVGSNAGMEGVAVFLKTVTS